MQIISLVRDIKFNIYRAIVLLLPYFFASCETTVITPQKTSINTVTVTSINTVTVTSINQINVTFNVPTDTLDFDIQIRGFDKQNSIGKMYYFDLGSTGKTKTINIPSNRYIIIVNQKVFLDTTIKKDTTIQIE